MVAELARVARLLSERLHRTDARHRLNEMHDQAGGCDARQAEHLLRAHLEPARQHEQWDERGGQHEPARGVEQDQRARREPHIEQARHELVDARVEQLANGVEVARLARDDAARGVRLVELEAQILGVQEDALAQVEQNRLTDARAHHLVPGDCCGADEGGENEADDDEGDGHPIAVVGDGRQAPVDAERDQRRARNLQRRREHDDDHREHDAAAHGAQQRAEQAQ